MGDGDDTILNVIDLFLAELGWQVNVVVDEDEEDGPGDDGAEEKVKIISKGFHSHVFLWVL